MQARAFLCAFLAIFACGGALSDEWEAIGPGGAGFKLSRTFMEDGDYGRMMVLVVNVPPEQNNLPEEEIHQFADQIIAEECQALKAVPSTNHIRKKDIAQARTYDFKGVTRISWIFLRHCVPSA